MNISVVTGTYNHRETLPKLYESLRKEGAEWIICDDGSTDGTWEYITQLAKKHDWIEGFSQVNKGMRLSRSLNNGLLRATGELIIVLMGDTHIEEGSLDWLKENYIEGTAGCGVRHHVDKEENHHSWDWILEMSKFPLYRVVDVGSFSRPWASLTGNSMIVPRQFIQILDGWDENYTEYGRDDWDFFMRLHQMGVPLFSYTGFIVNHFFHSENTVDNPQNVRRFEDKYQRMMKGENICTWK